jgi:hypothetical protein
MMMIQHPPGGLAQGMLAVELAAVQTSCDESSEVTVTEMNDVQGLPYNMPWHAACLVQNLPADNTLTK